MKPRIILILGDQLSPDIAALREADKTRDIVLMAEVADEAGYVPHHPKKIAFLFAAMRKFAANLEADGWRMRYTKLDDPDNAGSISGEILRVCEATSAEECFATEPGEFRLITALEEMPIPVHQFPDDRFLCSHAEFDAWAEGRKELRMEYFYREMRRKTGLLMDGDKPEGGKWNYDHDNRKPPPGSIDTAPMHFTPDDVVEEVLDLVAARFDNNFGDLRPFWFATDIGQARRALSHFISHALPQFGDYQDAMMGGEKFLYHSILSMYLNAGLLTWHEICEAAAEAYAKGTAPLNAVEGFIRQIIGWREYMRGIYFREGPDYTQRNVLGHDRALPEFYWDGQTQMACMASAIDQTREEAYAHHIQRLMVTGNFALLAGIDPHAVHEWYLAVYADAYEWVEAPNVIGMSQFADGGIVGSKPYVSGGNYINKMSDYCKGCRYDVKVKTGEDGCPFNYLYWAFLHRHRDRFGKNPRMAQMYRTWMRMSDEKRSDTIDSAEAFLSRMSAGERV
ncbi:cryptochrome/photolyase family protein [Gymnodinialimonas sp. 2305UL16-5]|uniref:cryptochrome/photolyase family protein n=1 Tax=Gymnodinialimonas mytili TaxID=3126503 RepID=UPI00309FE016